MLRILDSKELDGYALKTKGGPPFELLSGYVIYIRRNSASDYHVWIQGTYWHNGRCSNKTAKIRFKNRGADRKMLAARILSSGLQQGNYISVFVMHQNYERVALDFKFHGLWRFHGYNGEINVVIGKIYEWIDQGTIRAKFMDCEKKNRSFVRYIYFRGRAAEAARKCLSPSSDSPIVVCICSQEWKDQDQASCYLCRAFEVVSSDAAI